MNSCPTPSAPTPHPDFLPKPKKSGRGCLIVLGVFVLLGVLGYLGYRHYFHAEIKPTELTRGEEIVVDTKIEDIETAATAPQPAKPKQGRRIVFTEHEVNGLLNKADLGDTFRIDFKDGYIDITTVFPVPEDVPVIGGANLRVSVDLALEKLPNGSLSFAVKNVDIAGLPLPDDFIGGIKGDNLIERLKDEKIFQLLSAGVSDLQIGGGELAVILAF
ncbi:MAG: hypothetical protein ACI8UO_000975 [Verrucomicrobiales bacterium]|jgi:hypothetical protein